MIYQAVNKVLHLLNGTLCQDASLMARIMPWKMHVLHLSIQGVRVAMWLQLTDQGFIQVAQPESNVNTTLVHGTPSVLLSILKQRGKRNNQIPEGLHIAGDVGFALALFRIMQQLEIDWQQALAGYVGDMPVFGVQTFMHHVGGFLSYAKQSHQDNVSGFVQDELHALPTRHAFTRFSEEVCDLRQQVERLHVRCQRLLAST